MKKFLESRLEKWKRLEELTARVSKYRLRNLSGEEVREFGRLYRRTAADLAIAREEVRDRRLINYLNHLVGRAHGAIYRSESSGFRVFLDFFRYEFPAVFRRTLPFTKMSFRIFMAGWLLSFGLGYFGDGFAQHMAPDLHEAIVQHRNWTESVNEANALASSGIQTNNITVTFFAFAGGILWGAGTVAILFYNGILIGMVMGQCVRHRFWDILIFMSGHGVIELTAIFIAGGAGLMLGHALLMPGDLRRVDALTTSGLQAVRLILGTLVMLLIAGLIEGFISPAHISPYYKFAVSISSGLLLIAYFSKPDRRPAKT